MPVPFVELSPSDQERISREVSRRATEAINDPSAFFSFTMIDDVTMRPVCAAAHQVVGFRFIQLYPRSVLRWFAGASKTMMLAAYMLWSIGRDRASRIAFVSNAEARAQKPVSMMRELIEKSPQVRRVFPWLRPASDPLAPWGNGEFTIERPPGIRDATCTAYGAEGGSVLGSRLSRIVIDDVVTGQNAATKAGRHKLHTTVEAQVMRGLDPRPIRLGLYFPLLGGWREWN